MRDHNSNLDLRLEELLLERAVCGLEESQDTELQQLLRQHPEVDEESTDRLVAVVDLSFRAMKDLPTMPSHLMKQVQADARSFFVAEEPENMPPTAARDIREFPLPESSASTRPWSWLIAVAAGILAFVAWWPQIVGSDRDAEISTWDDLIVQAKDEVVLDWSPSETDPAAKGATGQVLWSAELQRGFMRFEGLEANDPSVSQYQLWVFDKKRDASYPVDGGVFNITDAGDVVDVPIDVRVPVNEAFLFAVTVEPPGGVVVSKRERIVLTAQP